MTEFDKILEISNDERVSLGLEAKELMHKWLMLGMSRYVCRHGTLSEGHEKLTPAQQYAQCYKEIWARANEIMLQKANALEARADLLEAEEELSTASTEPNKMRAEAKVLRAKQRLTSCAVNMEDSMRQLDEFNKVRIELKDKVEAAYPMGLEQAEPENWATVARYRASIERATGQAQNLRHVPLDSQTKAEIGMRLHNGELLVHKSIEDPKGLQEMIQPILQALISKESN